MSFISPNFEVDTDQNTVLISPKIGNDGNVDSYLVAENLGAGSRPIHVTEEIDRDKMLLAQLDAVNKMYLYPNGKIKIEP